MTNWESPIQMIINERNEQLADKATTYIEEMYDIHVDKDRLLSILQNAKHEWEKGYFAGQNDAVRYAYVCKNDDVDIWCSSCGSCECWGNYCMNCGAKMKEKQDD